MASSSDTTRVASTQLARTGEGGRGLLVRAEAAFDASMLCYLEKSGLRVVVLVTRGVTVGDTFAE